MKVYKRLKDPIYGYIQVPIEYMTEIVDTAVFQRLRRIIQTSYSPLYSSAVHNRFVHSLGVYHLGTIAANALCREAKTILEIEDIVLERLYRVFVLACLLHDVGHAPFSHTGEKLYLEENGDLSYTHIHQTLSDEVGTDSFRKDIPSGSGNAAPHEIMSAIVGLKAFPKYISSPEDKEFFARCITGYQYTQNDKESCLKNCFISLLNSKVIDVDKLDYLIRDAYITGFNTVSLDYIRLLQAITISETEDGYQIAYYKDAISVIENVVYAHDAERKWIQNHPIVLYECYILNHIFQYLNEQLNTETDKLFSYQSLTKEGHVLKDDVKVSLLCDDDIVYIMKNIRSCETELSEEYFERNCRRHPIWKSEAEYEAFISRAMGGQNDSMEAFEQAMTATASYLTKASDTWTINDETIEKLDKELKMLDTDIFDADTKKAQKRDKQAALKLMKCLIRFADEKSLAHDFVIIEASQFNSGFAKPDFSKTPLIFKSSDQEIVEANFATVAKPLQSNQKVRDKFYYLFYRRQHGDEEIDKAKLCKCLAQEFSTLSTKRRKYV